MGRAPWVAGVLAAVPLVLTACSADDEVAPGDDSATAPSPSAAPTPSAEEEVLATFQAYWDELTEIQNAGEVSEDSLRDVASGAVLEENLARFERYEDIGLVRTGGPRFKELDATVQGAEATVVGCLNENEWGFRPKGEEIDYPDIGWQAIAYDLERDGDRWVVTDVVTGAEKPC